MPKDTYELQFDSEKNQVRSVVRRLMEFVDHYDPSLEVRNDLRLVFSELLYNAVLHGNNSDPQKSVSVHLKVDGSHIYAQVRDEGPGFDYAHAIEYALSDEALLDEHSRGIVLVSGLTENLSFNEAGNLIRFEKRLK